MPQTLYHEHGSVHGGTGGVSYSAAFLEKALRLLLAATAAVIGRRPCRRSRRHQRPVHWHRVNGRRHFSFAVRSRARELLLLLMMRLLFIRRGRFHRNRSRSPRPSPGRGGLWARRDYRRADESLQETERLSINYVQFLVIKCCYCIIDESKLNRRNGHKKWAREIG